jgi:hypothetical protein
MWRSSRGISPAARHALGIAWPAVGRHVLLVPVTQLMISNWGWSPAYVGLAVITSMLVIPPVPLFLPPTSTAAKAAPAPKAQPEEPPETDWTVKRARHFRILLLFIARTLAISGQSNHRHAPDRPPSTSATPGLRRIDLWFDGVVSIGGGFVRLSPT